MEKLLFGYRHWWRRVKTLFSPSPNGGSHTPPLDISVLQDLVGDDPGVTRELLQDFGRNSAKLTADIRAAMAATDLAAVGAAAHSFKSSARAVGAKALGDICARLEAHAKNAQNQDLERAMELFEIELNAVDRYREQLLDNRRQ